ncbi:MAG: flagellar hook-length control protein FliK [Lachnospiraceae bacterium]|nr:flagellar hook-length control protein FliK [Lachnospiraceae bacterium]
MVSKNVSGSNGVYMDTCFDFTPKVLEGNGVDFKNLMNNSGKISQESKDTVVSKDNNPKDMDYLNKSPIADKLNQVANNTAKELTSEMCSEIEQKIKQVLMKSFNVSEEELLEAMNSLGLTYISLLDNTNLASLSMELNNVTESILLVTDAELAIQFKDITAQLGQIITDFAKELDITPKELESQLLDIDVVDEEFSIKDVKSEENDVEVKQEAIVNDDSAETEIDINKKDAELTKDNSNSKSSLNYDAKDNSSSEPKMIVADIVNNLKADFATAIATKEYSTTSYIDAMDIVEQIIDAVKVTNSLEGTGMEIQLNPEHLGKINLNVVAKDGVITAQIAAQDEAVKKILEGQLVTLKENLNNQGLKVEAVEVTISSHGFEQQYEENHSEAKDNFRTRKVNRTFKFDDADEEEADDVMDEVLKSQGNSVNFTA